MEHGTYMESLEAATEALLGGQADVLVENEYVMSLFTMKNYITDSIHVAGAIAGSESDNVYVAFSPVLPESKTYADLLTAGMKNMKSDGSWKTLLEKYGLEQK